SCCLIMPGPGMKGLSPHWVSPLPGPFTQGCACPHWPCCVVHKPVLQHWFRGCASRIVPGMPVNKLPRCSSTVRISLNDGSVTTSLPTMPCWCCVAPSSHNFACFL
uniref:Uncharacterized protein n=1 Tax=Laticauda laticaudata TaxID=8630 RepID=A0A8C5S9L2_LATLA